MRIETKCGSLVLVGTIWHSYMKLAKGDYRRQSTGHTDLAKAKEWQRDRYREDCSGEIFDRTGEKRTFEDLAVSYVRDHKIRRGDLPQIERLVSVFGTKHPLKIRPSHIKAFVKGMEEAEYIRGADQDGNEIKHRYSKATINNHLRWLRAILRFGSELDWYSVKHIARVKVSKKGENVRWRATTWKEIKDLFEHATGHVRTVLGLGLYAGLRSSEIKALRAEQLDFEKGLIYISERGCKEQYPKWIPIVKQLRMILMAREPSQSGYVVTFQGEPIKSFRTAFYTLRKNAGAMDFSPHHMRHFANHILRQAGVDERTRMAWLGHHVVQMGEVYDHTGEEESLDARQKLGDLIERKLKVA